VSAGATIKKALQLKAAFFTMLEQMQWYERRI